MTRKETSSGKAVDIGKQAELRLKQQLVFAKALNEIAETIISRDNSEDILENSNRIIGETLQLDRALIYDVSFEKNCITGLCEWLKLKHQDIAFTKGRYSSLDIFLSPFTEIKNTQKYLESQFNAVNEHFIKDGSGKILHEQLNIKSLLWYPFAFDEHGYYLFTLNSILEQRQWTHEEIGFLGSVSKQVTLALIKIKLLEERKHAEEALQKSHDNLEQRVAARTKDLRESEEKYRRLTDNMSDIVAELDTQGIITYNSPSNYRIFGKKHNAQIGKSAFDSIHPEDRDRVMAQYMEGVRSKTDREVEYRFQHEDGHYIWLRTIGHSMFDAAGDFAGMITTSSVIDERKKAEEKLWESEKKFRTFFGAMTEMVALHELVFNEQGDAINYRIIDCNNAYTKIIGIKKEDAVGKLSTEVYKTETPPYLNDYTRVALTETPCELTTYFEPMDKHFSISVVSLPKNNFATITTDITERKRVSEKLEKNEHRLHMIVEHVNDAFYIHDFEGNIIDLNDNACRMMDYTREEFLAPGGLFLIDAPMNSELTQDHLLRLMRDGFLVFEGKHKRKDGKMVDVNVSARIVSRDGKGIVQSFVSDITGRKQAEADKEKLEAQNRQLQKSESLGRMAASIAHHFNNQLGAVIGNLEMAMDELPKGASTHQTLTKSMKAAWTAADMSGLMLTYLGQTHDKRESLDLSYSCRKILPLIKTTLPGNVFMETDFPLPRPIIIANAVEIQQMLTNLINNAREAIGKNNGTIYLSVKTVSPAEIPAKNRFPIDWQKQDNTYACLEVTDTGCGIATKDTEQLFDPFFTDKFTGRGMGLPVVLGLVNSHKGVITVDSKLGSGSTFRLFFPVSEESLQQSQTADNDRNVTMSITSPGKMEEVGTVLVVEDEEMLRDMAATMLESFGFTVLKAKDGIEALEIFGKHQSKIKFVLTDLTMPRMNGWETLTELRKLQPNILVILASGYDKAHVMKGDHPELPQAFLAKPYNLKAIRAAISQTLETRK